MIALIVMVVVISVLLGVPAVYGWIKIFFIDARRHP